MFVATQRLLKPSFVVVVVVIIFCCSSLKLFKDGKPIDYNGGRTIEAFDAFLAKNLGDGAAAAAKKAANVKPGDIEQKEGVYQLNDDNFAAAINDVNTKYFVKFFAPWCGHCKNMAPAWKEFGTGNADKSLKVAEVDCTVSADACAKFGVRGYPT